MKRKYMPGLADIAGLFNTTKPIRLGMDFLKVLTKFSMLPGISRFHPWTKKGKTNVYWIPVNKAIEKPHDIPLPHSVVEEFIEKSSARVIMDFCGCRKGYKCKDFPIEVGCLMMGPGAERIPLKYGRKATKDEARAHLMKAVDSGLTPVIGKARIDNFIFGVPDDGDMLTVCFCCNCCCILYLFEKLPSSQRNALMKPLDGLKVWVDEGKCIGCGKCIDNCYIHAISIIDEKAHITEDCRGCGRCIPSCPQKSIKISLDNPDFVKNAVNDILKYVSV